jgi:hypothetical protein
MFTGIIDRCRMMSRTQAGVSNGRWGDEVAAGAVLGVTMSHPTSGARIKCGDESFYYFFWRGVESL